MIVYGSLQILRGHIYFGNNTLIGPSVLIHSGNHNYQNRDVPIKHQGYTFQEIRIGSDVWIGANVTILKGVEIGDGAVIAAGAVVTKSLKGNKLYAGVPAKDYWGY